jgi:mRNA-degrading endonuclease toxin of MazEF toxin-antitoxin module
MVYWVELAHDKRRPALVVSPELRNVAANNVLVAPITSQLRFGPWHVTLRAGEAGLPRSSVVKCEDVQVVRRELFNPRPIGGPLSAERMREVETALMSALGIK